MSPRLTRRRPLRRLTSLTVLALALALTGCGDSDDGDETVTEETTDGAVDAATDADQSTAGGAPGEGAPGEVTGDLTVFAAASLTDTFTTLGEEFETANPDATVTFSFAGSSALAQQILSGAPADVFASASPATMALVTAEGLATGEPVVFVSNLLQIAVPGGNPAGVTGLEDFTNEDLTIALCAEEVPCGAASLKVFEAAGLTPAPDTYEEDVRAALTKVRLDEVDAALVYRTDVLVAGDEVEGIDFPEAGEAVNDYSIAVLTEASNAAGGAAFLDFVLSETGRGVLGESGFELP